MIKISLKEMFEAGVHFGHQTRRWNPKMRENIYTKRRGIHIIDLKQTATHLQKALEKVFEVAATGQNIVFVCTKSGVNEAVAANAADCGMPFIKRRWLGGFLTNWKTIKKRIDVLNKLEAQVEAGDHERYTKKEQVMLGKKIDRLNMFLGGVKHISDMPAAVIVFDITRDKIAVDEAKKMGIPVIGLVDTNANPLDVDFPIPANDDALKAVEYMADIFKKTIEAGKNAKPKKKPAKAGDAKGKKKAPRKDDIQVPDEAIAEKGDN